MTSAVVRAHARIDNRNLRNSLPPSPLPPLDPTPQESMAQRPQYSISQRVHCLSLQMEGFSYQDIKRKIGIK
jgi:hypothetical protein